MVEREWLGRRVVVRHPSPGHPGRLTDALGDLVALDDTGLVVETRRGRVRVAHDDLQLTRLVEPAPRDQLALERIAARGWRAAQVQETPDGWLLRADRGWTGRANSALPLRTPGRPLTDVLAEVTAFYAERGLVAQIQVPLPAHAHLDRALGRIGWTFPEDNDVLVARLDLLPVIDSAVTVELAPAPDRAWLNGYHYRGGALPEHAVDLLTRHDRVVFAQVREGGNTVAVARGVVDDGWLGITALDVASSHRRRGIALAVVRALADWALRAEAGRAYLQVSAANVAAHALYRRLGFYRHHSYRYRFAPTMDR